MSNPDIVLTGSAGVLGTYIDLEAKAQSHNLHCLDRRLLEYSNKAELFSFLDRTSPNIIINCAADTDTEGAEENQQRAYYANVEIPGTLARYCAGKGIKFVHFSSTGCYGNYKDTPYTEYDDMLPTTVSHRSKYLGELATQHYCSESICLRLGWVFGGNTGHRKNFVLGRIREATGESEISSDPFQVGNPTYAGDIAVRLFDLIADDFVGIANCVSEGPATRYDYVKRIIDSAKLSCRVVKAKEPFIRKAAVSHNESAINLRMRILGYPDMPDWKASLDYFTKSLRQNI